MICMHCGRYSRRPYCYGCNSIYKMMQARLSNEQVAVTYSDEWQWHARGSNNELLTFGHQTQYLAMVAAISRINSANAETEKEKRHEEAGEGT